MSLFTPFFNTIYYRPKRFITRLINRRLHLWLSKRLPGKFSHTLNSRNIFIIPTKFGFAFLLFDCLLFLLGTNYQNNTILLFCYLLASLFITVMLHSFFNLSKLTLSSARKQFSYANQMAFFPITIEASKQHFDLNFYFVNSNQLKGKDKINVTSLSHCCEDKSTVAVPFQTSTRGLYDMGRVKVYSEYSLGLFISWSMLDFSHQLVVYPQPKKLPTIHKYLSSLEDTDDDQSTYNAAREGMDDFSELKSHIVGESQGRIAWKQLARGQGKLSKHYQSQQGSLLWLKLSDMPSRDIETKLRYLCYLILEYGKSEQEYGIILDVFLSTGHKHTSDIPVKILPSKGLKHQQKCLMALATLKLLEEGNS